MPKISLSDAGIRALKPPEQGQITVWDAASPIGLRISQGGSKTFIVMIGSGKRHVIGRYPIVTLSDARQEAKRILAEKTLGITKPDPTETFGVVLDLFLEAIKKRNKPRTIKDYTYYLNRFFKEPFGDKEISKITPKEISRKIEALSETQSTQIHAYVYLRGFFRWAVQKHYLERSPMEGMAVPSKLSSRERALTDPELQEVCTLAFNGEDTYSKIISLLLLTGQRRGEIAALKWEWIDSEKKHITLPKAITKNKREHCFPIGSRTLAIIEKVPRTGDYLFPAARSHVRGKPTATFNGWSKSFTSFYGELKNVEPFTVHDLRRTLSTGMAGLKVPQHVVEKLLNHVSGGEQSPIAQVYNRYSYMAEMREAVEKWEAKLERLVGPDSPRDPTPAHPPSPTGDQGGA
jgi:integrase